MNEQKDLNEQELEKVTGGTGDNGFESAWAAYVSANCGDCIFQVTERDTFCESEKLHASQAYAAGQPIACKARMVAP